MLKGQYPHNTRVLDNVPPYGGHETSRKLRRDQSTYATWLDEAGYHTGYFSKYMNGCDDKIYIPPGWDRWIVADHAPATMRISNDGKLVKLGDRYETSDLAMKHYSVNFLKKNLKKRRPWFMAVSFSPHTEHGTAKYEKICKNPAGRQPFVVEAFLIFAARAFLRRVTRLTRLPRAAGHHDRAQGQRANCRQYS